MVDIETNDLPLSSEILEISIRILDDNNYPTDIEFSSLIKPSKKLCKYSKDVCGFSDEELVNADPPEVVKSNLCFWIYENFVSDRVIPIGHNYSGFDKPRLELFLGNLMYDRIFHYHSEDTMIIARNLKKAGFIKSKSCSLKHLTKYFGIKNNSFHRASKDTMYTGLLYYNLMKILKPSLTTRIIRVFNPTYAGVKLKCKNED